MQCHNANFDQVSNRFDRLWLKNEPIATVDHVTQEDIAVLHKHVCSLFPGVNRRSAYPEKICPEK